MVSLLSQYLYYYTIVIQIIQVLSSFSLISTSACFDIRLSELTVTTISPFDDLTPVFLIAAIHLRQHRTELVVQDAYGQIYLARQIFRQIV